MNKLSGKVAVVTGASKGIGASIAEHLAAEGASVVVNYASSKGGAEAVVARIKEKGGKAIAVQGNVARLEDIEHLFSETKKTYGKVDILVNNAGTYEFAPLEGITPEHIHKHFDLNVTGLLLTTQAAAARGVFPRGDGKANPASADRPAGRYRSGGDFPGQRRRPMDHRTSDCRGRRQADVSVDLGRLERRTNSN
jgi:3-oxoacyl-[acyl-carrier protein] reductase